MSCGLPFASLRDVRGTLFFDTGSAWFNNGQFYSRELNNLRTYGHGEDRNGDGTFDHFVQDGWVDFSPFVNAKSDAQKSCRGEPRCLAQWEDLDGDLQDVRASWGWAPLPPLRARMAGLRHCSRTRTSSSSASTHGATGSTATRPSPNGVVANGYEPGRSIAACGRTSGSVQLLETMRTSETGAGLTSPARLTPALVALAGIAAWAALAATPPGSATSPNPAPPSAPRAGAAATPVQSAIQLFQSGKTADAKAAFEAILKRDPKNAEAHYYLGRIAIAAQDFDGAADRFQQAAQAARTARSITCGLARLRRRPSSPATSSGPFSPTIRKVRRPWPSIPGLDAHFDLARFYVLAGHHGEGKNREASREVRIDPLRATSASR
jgi:hypothetical protein